MKLIHYSALPVSQVHSVSPQERGGRGEANRCVEFADKPKGFWVSDDDEERNWREWCEGEQWNFEALAYPHEIILRSDAN